MKKSKILYLFIFLFSSIFLGAANKYLTALSMILSIAIGFRIALIGLKERTEKIPIGIIIVLCLQNFLIGTGSHFFGNLDDSLKFLTQIPFIVIFINWGAIFLFKREKYSRKLFIIYVFFILLSLIIDRGSIYSIMLNIRNMTLFYMAFSIGFYHIDTKAKLDGVVKALFKISFWILILGIILYFGGYKFYKVIGIDEIYFIKLGSLIDYLDNRFYTTLIRHRVMRMGSIFYDPVNLAYFYSCTFLLSIFYSDKKKIFNIIVNGVGLLLSFGKGGYLLTGIVMFYILIVNLLYKCKLNKSIKTISKISIVLIILFASLFCIFYYLNIGAAATVHFEAIINTFKSIIKWPFGYGLGTGGNYSIVYTNNTGIDLLSSGGETAFMSFFYQIGIQGVLMLTLLMLSLSVNKIKNKIFNLNFSLYLKIIPLTLLFCSLFQDNTFSPQCIVLFMLIQGSSIKIAEYGKDGINND